MLYCHTTVFVIFWFQSSKVLAKKELSFVPVLGWMWYFLEMVFCKRKWEEDRTTVVQSLRNLRDYPENFWVYLKKSYCTLYSGVNAILLHFRFHGFLILNTQLVKGIVHLKMIYSPSCFKPHMLLFLCNTKGEFVNNMPATLFMWWQFVNTQNLHESSQCGIWVIINWKKSPVLGEL